MRPDSCVQKYAPKYSLESDFSSSRPGKVRVPGTSDETRQLIEIKKGRTVWHLARGQTSLFRLDLANDKWARGRAPARPGQQIGALEFSFSL